MEEPSYSLILPYNKEVRSVDSPGNLPSPPNIMDDKFNEADEVENTEENGFESTAENLNITKSKNQEAKYEIGNWKIFTYFKANALFCFFKILLCENCVYSSTIDFKTFEFNYTVKFPRLLTGDGTKMYNNLINESLLEDRRHLTDQQLRSVDIPILKNNTLNP
ncbi:hypothetical protein QTP88_029282 [Uroleucon formosanum]